MNRKDRLSSTGLKNGSRRHFLQTGGKAAAGSLLATMAVPHVHAAEDNTIRLALIGCGGRGSGAAVNAFEATGGPVKLVAMADIFEKRLAAALTNLSRQHPDKIDVPKDRQFVGFDFPVVSVHRPHDPRQPPAGPGRRARPLPRAGSRRLEGGVIMHSKSIVRLVRRAVLAASVLACAALCGAAEDDSRWVHPLCQPLAVESDGPLVELADGSLMTIEPQGTRRSQDDGKTWSEPWRVCEGLDGLHEGREPASSSIVRTRGGALVIVYLDSTTYNFSWDDKINQPKDDCRLEIWAIRSLDGGKTWVDRQRILEGYNPNFFGFIQTRGGRLVATVPHLVRDPGRYVACSLTSDDEGKTWKRSNLIDLGGHGHHSGAMEPTVAELSDGRLLMLIRTHWGRFWEALSDDGGLSWRIVRPSQIESTSAPGFLLKLRSGRLALVANDKAGRTNLLLAFSEDDGKTWTKPVILARQKDGQLSYPYCLERRPGELWVIAGFAFKKGWQKPLPLRLKVNEEAFLREANKETETLKR